MKRPLLLALSFVLAASASGSPQQNQSSVVVRDGAQAQKVENARLERKRTIEQYAASGGASGSVTLTNGTKLEVVRIGTSTAAIGYRLDGPGARDLREVRSVERITPPGKAAAEYRVVFSDGEVTVGKHALSNYYRFYQAHNQISTEVGFGGISSDHMRFVVRRSANAKPTNALITLQDIAKLEINAFDTKPSARIEIAETDPALETSLITKWRAAASGKPRSTFDPKYAGDLGWCRTEDSTFPIELKTYCAHLFAEQSLAERQGFWSADTTPVSMIVGYDIYSLKKRSVY